MTAADARSGPYLLLHPRLDRAGGSRERRRVERFDAQMTVRIRGVRDIEHVTANVSREGLLVVGAVAPLRQPLMLDLLLVDGALSVMAIVVRHAVVVGRHAMGLKLLPMSHARELRWARTIDSFTGARQTDALVPRAIHATEPVLAGRAGEYSLVFRREKNG